MGSGSQNRVAMAGLAATLLTGLSLAPLIQGLGWFVAAFVIVALTTGTGAAVRQVTRQWPLVVAAQVVVLALAVTTLFARDSAQWGLLPGPTAWQTLSDLVSSGMQVTRLDAPPVEATRGLILLAGGGVALVGLAVDVIAVSLRRPAVAGLPLLAVYCIPTAVLPGGLGWQFFVLAGAGFLILVGADASDRVRGWGRILGAPATDRDGLSAGAPLSGARRVGVACLAVAVVVPAAIPGLGERLLGRTSGLGPGSGNGSTIKVVNPILDLRQNLGSRSGTVVISYRTDDSSPQPLRIVTDDTFDGSLWAPSAGSLSGNQRVQNGLPSAPGLTSSVAVTLHSSQITIANLAETYLPLPYPTTKVAINGPWLWDGDTLNVVGWGVTTKNVAYTAQYLTVQPTSAQLQSAPAPATNVLSKYTALPRSLQPGIGRTARQVAGRGSAYDQAVRLQSWFRDGGGFAYSKTLPGDGRSDSGEDAVSTFLRTKVGYCVQFASAMAVMARTLGIPARVAVGFLPGNRGSDGSYSISLQDAHAWPELYFEGAGWVRFEPTPATRTGAPPAYTIPQTTQPLTSSPTATPSVSAGARPSGAARPDPNGNSAGSTRQPATLTRVLQALPWRLVGVLFLLLLLLATPRLAIDTSRRRGWRRATTAQQRAETGWAELRDRLADLGVRWAPSWTPRALQGRLTKEHDLPGQARAALSHLVDDIEQARYARPSQLSRPPGERIQDIRTVAAAVARTVPPRTRRLARLMPPSGLALLAGLARNVDAAADQATQRASTISSQVRRSVNAHRGGDR